MGLITVNDDQFDHVALIKDWTEDYKDVFSDKLSSQPGKQTLKCDETVIMPNRPACSCSPKV